MDKRDLSVLFRDRLLMLIGRHNGNLSAFSRATRLDRSALSQFLSESNVRLPRAETLRAIAVSQGVTADWLLGLTQVEEDTNSAVPIVEFQQSGKMNEDKHLRNWQNEAVGYKIRYVPADIPDLLKSEQTTRQQYKTNEETMVARQDQSRQRLEYSRKPETDIEACMPAQTLEAFARGEGIWSGFSTELRRKQLEEMAVLLDELYPTFRLFLFDSTKTFSAPYTVFGPLRAAIYLGDVYMVVNGVEQVRALTRHFDQLIRLSHVPPDQSRKFVLNLLDNSL